ncbi:MAG: site-specific DNA-methyltransferase [Acidovorax sp.]|uniref:site-specific DNA-methyltransferase n=1 Tax=Acidovorax sp. TaxID=1872122 RepID=UPI0039E4ABA3
MLGQERIAPAEHYELNWAGKTAARREIQKTTSHTLLPDAGNPAQAQHMLIEGENLEVLRVLQKSYYGKVKMIYIDPPYNTGNDSFVYPDDYSETLEEYQRRTGERNEAGFLNKQSLWKKNSKESGQYHSAWLSMMYPRLYLARNLLRDDGVIFISIDENEMANLKLLCDEIFGSENFYGFFVWKRRSGATDSVDGVSVDHESVLCYGKNKTQLAGMARTYEGYSNPDNDPRGPWKADNLSAGKAGGDVFYPIKDPETGNEFLPPSGRYWPYSRKTMAQKISEGRVIFPKNPDGRPMLKRFKEEAKFDTVPVSTWMVSKEEDRVTNSLVAPINTQSTRDLQELLGGKHFSHPKSIQLISSLASQCLQNSDGIVIDFFAGSGTTAQAVMAMNIEDSGNRQCICVQMPEVLEQDTEAYKAGYRTIADITRARIDKVIAKLKTEHPDKTADLACAHFKLAPSSFKVWRSDVADAAALRDQLALFQQAEKADKPTQETDAQTAMLAELLLKHGLGALGVHAISKPKTLAGATVHRVLMPDDRQLWLCFDTYTEALKDEIVKARPAQVILLNSCFVGDKADELLSNLQLELKGLDIGLLVI